jgi:AcrR family transcriptional regulator
MFLLDGFDNVTVAQIAAAADVSQQTVFNYFPTKESMFLDRAEPMTNAVADAVRERGSATLVEAVVQSMADEIHPGRWEALDEAGQLQLFRRFCDVATGSPTLVAARFAELPRFIDEVSIALAQRIGAESVDPEVQLATLIIGGLVRVRVQSSFHHVQHATSFAALNDAVRRDILRAAELAEPSLAAFDNLRGTADD